MKRTDALREMLRSQLEACPVRVLHASGLRRAAVVLAVVDAGHGADLPGFAEHAAWSDEAAVLLTRRAAAMNRHAGQWALPGGRIDAGETAPAAALRELQEELGLHADPDSVIGTLDDYATRSGYVITPFVLWAGSAPDLQPDPAEVCPGPCP